MKKLNWIIIGAILVGALSQGFAQNIVFGGSNVIITENAQIHVLGDVSFVTETSFQNNGEVYVGGDWKNFSNSDLEMQNGAGTVVFYGQNEQMIGGDERTFFSNLSIQQNVFLDVETRIYSGLKLGGSVLTLNKHNLFIMPGAEISGADAMGYVDASSEGFLIQHVANQEVLFPVGTSSAYLPAYIQNQGVADNYGLQLFPDVLSGGNSGTTIPEIENCVINTWNIIEEVPGGSMFDITVQWDQPAEGINFNRSLSAVGHYSGAAWAPGDPSGASGSGPWQQSLSGVAETGAFAVGDPESPMAVTIQYDEQELTLPEGWSGLSSFLNPLDPDFDVIFTEVLNEIEIVQDLYGVYWPSQGVNTLGSWDTYSGYQVKMAGEVTFNFTGTPVVDASVDLDVGWNLIPILINCKSEPIELFDGLPVVLVREVAGTGIYWPDFNINTLEFMIPGSAYMVYANAAAELDFPACKKSALLDNPPVNNFEKLWDPITDEMITMTNVQHTVAIRAEAMADAGFNYGDYVMAVSGDGRCFGSTLYQGVDVSVVIFGDDLSTIEKDGFGQGEQLSIIRWDALTGEATSLDPVFEYRFFSHNGQFMDNGISVITAFNSSESNTLRVSVYPNPADDFFRIRGNFQHADLRIMDLQGSQRMFYKLKENNKKIDISGLSTGVYFIEVRIAGGLQIFRERLIVK